MSDAGPIDVLLSQRFLPEPGGSIRWMYEVYRRWPKPVEVITHDYYASPPGTPEFPEVPAPPDGVDHVREPQLVMDRRVIFMDDWGMESPKRLMRYLRMTRAVRERLRRPESAGRIIRVHCTHAVPEVVSLLPLRRRYGERLRVICYAHGEEITACRSSRQLSYLMKRAHAAVDVMIANSEYTAGLLAEHMDPGRVRVVHPGVSLDEYRPAEAMGRQWRAENGLADNVIALTLGRLDPRKNQAAVIEAVAKLAGQHPRLTYLVAGEGRERAALEQLSQRLGVADRVRFLGPVDGETKIALYGACDFFVMPAVREGTDVEGFGIVFLEAGACGKPCIAGTAGGQADAVLDGESGFVVDGRDQDQLTEAMDRLLRDTGLRAGLGQGGLRQAELHDWQRVVQRTVGLVEEVSDHPAAT